MLDVAKRPKAGDCDSPIAGSNPVVQPRYNYE